MSGTYNKMKGTAQKAVGAGKEEVGKEIYDPELQSKGILEQAQGAASKAFGNAKEAISDGMSALNLHASEYKKRTEFDYVNDFNIYKLEKEVSNQERMLDVYTKRAKLAEKAAELAEVSLVNLEDLDALFKAELDRASKL